MSCVGCSDLITVEEETLAVEGVGNAFECNWVEEENDETMVDCVILIDDDLVDTTEFDIGID